jgi:hypothetical protein
MDIESELRCELRELRGGYGVWRTDLADRFGHRLRSELGVADPALSSVRARELVREMIDVLLAGHADAQLALRAAVALQPETREKRTFDQRVQWLAGKLNYGDRTARRRIDDAIALLAQAIVADRRGLSAATRRGAPDEVDYVIESLHTDIKLIGNQARVAEWREIRALTKLSEIRCKFSLPEPPDGVDREVGISILGGGELLDYQARPGNVVEFSVEPPRPLEEDDEHRFGIEFLFPPGYPMAPLYAVHPATRFRFFDLTIHFDLGRLPLRVWKIDGVLHPETGSYQPGMEELTPDSSGIVGVRFENLPEGRSRGVGWAWWID